MRAAVVATIAGAFVAHALSSPLLGLAVGCTTVTVVFVLLGWALGAQGFAPALESVRSVTRRLSHGRFR